MSSALKEVLDRHSDVVAGTRQGVCDASPAVAEALIEIFDAAREQTKGTWAGSLQLRTVPSVTHLLHAFHFREPPSRFISEENLARGRAIHLACQYDDENRLDEESVHPSVMPFLQQFRRWRDEVGSTRSIAWELDLTHSRFGYRGRFDNLRWRAGKRALVDIKTNDADEATAMQLALYDHLLADAAKYDQPDEWYALVLKPTTYRWKRVAVAEMPQWRADALALVRTYHALARLHGTTVAA